MKTFEDLKAELLHNQLFLSETNGIADGCRRLKIAVVGEDDNDSICDAIRVVDQAFSALGMLTPREAKVLRMRFGIDLPAQRHTLAEVGKQFDVTRERIRQIEAKALRKLRHPNRKAVFFGSPPCGPSIGDAA